MPKSIPVKERVRTTTQSECTSLFTNKNMSISSIPV